MDPLPKPTDTLVLSYLELRKSIGVIGIFLPFTVAFGKILLESPGILSSVSAYYYSIMGDVFVGSLSAIGVFLWSYRGYEMQDAVIARFAAIFAIGVALFPTVPESGATQVQVLISGFHVAFAGGFFVSLAYFALFLFRKTNPSGVMTRMKKVRNAVYTVCGYTIIVCIGLIIVAHFLATDAAILAVHPIFWLESLAILAFGISWFVKGEAILKDE